MTFTKNPHSIACTSSLIWVGIYSVQRTKVSLSSQLSSSRRSSTSDISRRYSRNNSWALAAAAFASLSKDELAARRSSFFTLSIILCCFSVMLVTFVVSRRQRRALLAIMFFSVETNPALAFQAGQQRGTCRASRPDTAPGSSCADFLPPLFPRRRTAWSADRPR